MALIRNGVGGVGFALFAFLYFASPAWAQNFTIEKEASPDPVFVGQELTYTITVTNSGARIRDLELTDTLPDTVRFVEFGEISVAGRPDPNACKPPNSADEIVCDFDRALPRNEEAIVEIVVIPTRPGVITNTAEATGTRGELEMTTNSITQETLVLRPDRAKDKQKNKDKNKDKGRGFFRQYQYQDGISQEEQYLDAEQDLEEDEETNGEDTFGDDFDEDDDGPAVSATAGDGQAEASTPGAVASAGGDPDDLEPLDSAPDDVVDEIDTGGQPLPNTGGISLWVYGMAGAGGLLLLTALITNLRRRSSG